jgi:hypothetical protein
MYKRGAGSFLSEIRLMLIIIFFFFIALRCHHNFNHYALDFLFPLLKYKINYRRKVVELCKGIAFFPLPTVRYYVFWLYGNNCSDSDASGIKCCAVDVR